MSSSISSANNTTVPLLVEGYQSSVQSRNVFNSVIGGGTDVTLVPAGPPRGTLRLIYLTELDALDAWYTLLDADVLTFADSDLPTAGMSFVVDGSVTRQLDPETRTLWMITVDYQAVSQ